MRRPLQNQGTRDFAFGARGKLIFHEHPKVLPPNNAAAYVRMSTEHQQYSTSNQMDVIREYAKRRGMQIVKEYSDEGKSGLNIQGRESLAQMIQGCSDGQINFSSILVYDVSRWGRFQDADESAYYEYICRRAGVSVHYCAEQFENDGSPVSTIVKGVKRAMAGEYSRELSSKYFKVPAVDSRWVTNRAALPDSACDGC
jgi:DNA invertase Pin-like site-specific DNA recombinase